MTKKYPPEDEVERLAEHYEQLDDEGLLVEWERGEPVTIDVGEPMRSPKPASQGRTAKPTFWNSLSSE